MAAYSGSLALMAETAHNLADLAALATVWIGLTLSQRKSHSFPYGLYKVENVAAIVVGLFIFLTAYEIAKESLLESNREVVTHPAILLEVVIAALAPWLFSRYELRIAHAVNSPSLMADAKEFQAHVLSEIRTQISFIERVMIHIEPVSRETVRIAVPLSVQTGTVSRHFGLAPYFSMTKRHVETAQILEQMIAANPFAGHPNGRGLEVARIGC